MSQFQGYMGGNVGQGYDVSQGYDAGNATQGGYLPSQQEFQPSSPLPQTLSHPHPSVLNQTPTALGSVTQHYQPQQFHQNFDSPVYTSPQPAVQQVQTTAYPPQGVQQVTMHSQQVQPRVQVQHVHQPSVQAAQSRLQQQPQVLIYQQPNTQNIQVPQQPRVNQRESDSGSYAARSAQAHSVMGPPSPSKATASHPAGQSSSTNQPSANGATKYDESPAVQAQQNRILADCTRKVQENAYYMKQAMDNHELSTVLDRASSMVGELGDSSSGLLTPKNYYELHMRALDDMPNLEEYFLSLTGAEDSKCSMKDLYGYVQYCPRVLSRLYLQISAGSALIRSKEETAKSVLTDLIEAVKCVQNPLRGLFLRHFLLQVTRDKLPDGAQVQDAYEFVLANFIEMNRLWVRIQHLPGDGKSKEQRKRRERERNELRILVGTNLVRLSQLEAVSSKIYGEVVLPKILEQITACGDPLAQAYLIDCIIQVFPDEYHIETLPILLAVCPKLRDKVNIRTIVQSLMDRLANYYAEEELLDEADTNDVKKSIFRDSFPMFEDCAQKVFQARGPKLVSREVIRLQTSLLTFSLKCYPGSMDQVSRCLGVCIDYVRQAANGTAIANQTPMLDDVAIRLDQASITELEKMLSIPLDSLALKVLELDHYADLLRFLPWKNRRDVGMTMLRAIDTAGVAPKTVKEVEELFSIILPVIQGEELAQPSAVSGFDRIHEEQEESTLVSKLVHLLDHENPDVAYEMLSVARSYLSEGGLGRIGVSMAPVVFSALRLASKVSGKMTRDEALTATLTPKKATAAENDDVAGDILFEQKQESLDEQTPDNVTCSEFKDGTNESSMESLADSNEASGERKKDIDQYSTEHAQTALPTIPNSSVSSFSLSCRKALLFVQTTVALLSKGNPELAVKLYLQAAVAADGIRFHDPFSDEGFQNIVSELLAQAFLLHEEEITDTSAQQRCIVSMIGALLACKSLEGKEYERFITKAAQYAAKLMKKRDQCEMVALCSHLFYLVGDEDVVRYRNPQRTLECLQRSLKLADASVTSVPSNISLFVDLLEHYLYFFEEENPVITEAYITGLVALVREHLASLKGIGGSDTLAVDDAQSHFEQVVGYIRRRKNDSVTADRFALIDLGPE